MNALLARKLQATARRLVKAENTLARLMGIVERRFQHDITGLTEIEELTDLRALQAEFATRKQKKLKGAGCAEDQSGAGR